MVNDQAGIAKDDVVLVQTRLKMMSGLDLQEKSNYAVTTLWIGSMNILRAIHEKSL